MTVNAQTDFDAKGDSVLRPSKLAHVVFRTSNFPAMVKYWKTFLGGHAQFESSGLSFITYDDEHHRVAIAEIPHLGDKHKKNNGFEHVAFTFDTLDGLMLAYRQRKAHGIEPSWAVNHGVTISIYYKDPDGNTIETQYDAMEPDEATAFMKGPQFKMNPIGVDFDPEEFIERIKSGESLKSLVERKNDGPRGFESVLQRQG